MRASGSDSTSILERLLAYVLIAAVVLSVASFFAIMIGTWSGMDQADFGTGAWPAVAMTPYVGLPLAMLALIVLIIMSATKRSRANRQR